MSCSAPSPLINVSARLALRRRKARDRPCRRWRRRRREHHAPPGDAGPHRVFDVGLIVACCATPGGPLPAAIWCGAAARAGAAPATRLAGSPSPLARRKAITSARSCCDIEPRERHAVARHQLLGVGQVRFERLGIPGDAGLLHRRRIGKAGLDCRFAADDAAGQGSARPTAGRVGQSGRPGICGTPGGRPPHRRPPRPATGVVAGVEAGGEGEAAARQPRGPAPEAEQAQPVRSCAADAHAAPTWRGHAPSRHHDPRVRR